MVVDRTDETFGGVEELNVDQGVTGSIPVGGTKFHNEDNGFACSRRFHFVSRKVINSYKQIFGVRESRRKDEEVSM